MTETTELRPLGSTAGLGQDARRELGKWLNEEQNRPIDRVALAELCTDYDAMLDELKLWRRVGRALHDAGLKEIIAA
jgi:hypothetical protein